MSAVAAAAAASAAAIANRRRQYNNNRSSANSSFNSLAAMIIGGGATFQSSLIQPTFSRYESLKRRDWSAFCQFLNRHSPPLVPSRCSGDHVVEFLRYLDQFGKTKVHGEDCRFFGESQSLSPLICSCPCPLRQSWGSLDAMVARLRVAFEENGGWPEINPFGFRPVKLYLRQLRDEQAMSTMGVKT